MAGYYFSRMKLTFPTQLTNVHRVTEQTLGAFILVVDSRIVTQAILPAAGYNSLRRHSIRHRRDRMQARKFLLASNKNCVPNYYFAKRQSLIWRKANQYRFSEEVVCPPVDGIRFSSGISHLFELNSVVQQSNVMTKISATKVKTINNYWAATNSDITLVRNVNRFRQNISITVAITQDSLGMPVRLLTTNGAFFEIIFIL